MGRWLCGARRTCLVGLCVGTFAVLASAGAATASTISVGCSGSTGDVASLVAAIKHANLTPGPDVVQLTQGCVYTLTAVDNYWYGPNGLPPIASNITIEGSGATIARSGASGTPTFRLFFVGADPSNSNTLGYVSPGAGVLTLRDLTITGGMAQGGNSAGGGGGAGMGGAIFSQGSVTIENSTLTSNEAEGGSTGKGEEGGGGIGTNGSGSQGGGFGPGSFGGGMGGAGAAGGGGGGAGFATGEDGTATAGTTIGAGGGAQTGLGGVGGNTGGGASGDGSGGGGPSDSSVTPAFTGGAGGAFGAGGGIGPVVGSGEGGGGVGGGGGGSGNSGGGGGFGGGGGAAFQSQIGGSTLAPVGGNGGFGGGGGGGYGGVGAPGFGGGVPLGTSGGGGAGMGGAIFNLQGTVTITNSTLTANGATGGSGASAGSGYGGAIFNLNGSVAVASSTFALNNAAQGGGAIYDLVYDHATARQASASLTNSIAYGNPTAPDIVANEPATVANGMANLGTASLTFAGADIVGSNAVHGARVTESGTPMTANPLLGPLQYNGGPGMDTMAVPAGSPALAIGAACPNTDERGVARPAALCDLGAYQRSGTSPPVTPRLTRPSVSPSRFSLAGRLVGHRCVKPTRANRLHPRCRRAIAIRITYTLNVAATVTFTLQQSEPGRRVRGRCVAPTRRNRRRPRCTRLVPVRGVIIIRSATAGINTLIAHPRLGPASYVMTATATANGRVSTPIVLRFTIAR